MNVEATGTSFLGSLMGEAGIFEADRLSDVLHITKDELASTTGIPRATLYRTTRRGSVTVQTRLRETAEIVNRILPWCGGSIQLAFAWYRSQPIPAFGDATVATMVRQGRAHHVMSYIDGLAAGGYA